MTVLTIKKKFSHMNNNNNKTATAATSTLKQAYERDLSDGKLEGYMGKWVMYGIYKKMSNAQPVLLRVYENRAEFYEGKCMYSQYQLLLMPVGNVTDKCKKPNLGHKKKLNSNRRLK